MDMISGLLAQTQPKPQSPYDTITRLCDRLQHSSMLEDRRAAVLGLKGFSRDYREAVAAGGLRSLIYALHRDAEDVESCRATLETLIILFIQPNEQDDSQRTRNKEYRSPLDQNSQTDLTSRDYISLWLTDEFTQKEDNVVAILDLLRNTSDFYIKLYSLQLLSAIISGRPKRAQDCIFTAPLGISTVVAVLDDSREAIRNEAILVLLNLVADHSDVQKLVVFEGAFEKLFHIISEEGGLSGGVIVEDCLLLMASLLRYNMSNQNMFRETSCVPKLAKLLKLEPEGNPEDDDYIPLVWDDQLTSNLRQVLELCRFFVIQGHWATPVNQLALCKAGILMNVMRIVFGGIAPVPIRTAGLLTLADLIRTNTEIQHDFLAIDVPYVDLSVSLQIQRQPDIIPVSFALLNWALLSNSVHTFDLRSAAHLCLNAAMQDNLAAKKMFLEEQVSHYKGVVLMKETENGSVEKDSTNGNETGDDQNEAKNDQNDTEHDQNDSENDNTFDPSILPPDTANLISALADYDPDSRLNPYKTWFAAVILLYVFDDSDDNYQQALEIRETVQNVVIGDESMGEETVTFVQAVCGMLVTSLQYTDSRISIAYLMLLTVWLYDDVKVVNNFLSESTVVQSLISLITTHTGGTTKNILVEPMAAVLLGVAYDFTTKESPISRQELHKLLTGTIGRDQYVLKVKKLKEIPIFKDFDEEDHLEELERDETGLPNVFLCGVYVKFVRNYFNRIQKALDRDPLSEPNSRISLEMYDSLQQQYIQATKLLDELKEQYSESASTNSKKIEQLEDSLEKFKKEKEDYEKKLKENSIENNRISKELETISKEYSSLKDEHSKVMALNDKSSVSLIESTKQSDNLKSKAKSLQSQLQSMTELKEKAENGINKMNRELMMLTRSKTETDKQNSELEKKLNEFEKQIKKFSDVEKRLKDDFSGLLKSKKDNEDQLKKNHDLYEKLRSEYDELKLDFDETDKLKDTLIEKLKSAGSQIMEFKENIKRLEEERHDLQMKCEDLEKTNEELRKQMEEQKMDSEELKKVQDKVQISKEETKAWKDKVETMEVNEKELKEQLTKLKESHAEELKNELNRVNESHVEELKKLEENHVVKVKQLEESHAEGVKQLKKSHIDEVDQLKESGKSHNLKLDEMEKSHKTTLKELKKSHEIKLDDLRKSHSKEITEMKDSYAKELDDFKNSHQKLIDQTHSSHNETINQLQNRLETTQKELKSEKTKLNDQIESHKKQLKQSIDTAVDECESKSSEKINQIKQEYDQKLTDARKDGDESLRSELTEMKERYTQQIKDTLSKAKTHKTELSERDDQIDGLKVELKNEKERLEEKLKGSEKQLQDSEKKLKDSETQLKDVETQLKTAEQKLKDGEKQSNDSEKRLKDLEQQLNDSKQQLDDSKQQLKDSEIKKNQQIDEISSNHKKQLEEHSNSLEKQIEELKKQISKQKEDDSSSEKELERLKSLQLDLENKLKASETKVNEIQKEYTESKKNLEQKNIDIQTFEKKLTISQELYDKTSKEIKIKEQENEDLKRQLEIQEKHVKDLEIQQKRIDESKVQETLETQKKRIKELENELNQVKQTKQTSQLSTDTVPKSELDDLMLVMADLEESKNKYKKKLQDLNEIVSSDEEDDEDDDSDNDNDNENN